MIAFSSHIPRIY